MRALSIKDFLVVTSVSERVWLGVIVSIGLLTHFAWPLSQPAVHYFDEGEFAGVVVTYLDGQKAPIMAGNVTDIHPPHSKMVTALVARLAGYQPGVAGLFSLRFCAALCGVLIPLLFFILAREAGVGILAARLVALALCLDNGLIARTRMLSLDGILLTAALASFLFYFKSRRETGFRWVMLAGAFAGLALGTKFTGLSVGAFLILMYLFREKSVSRAGVFLAFFVLIYLGGWWIHYALTEPASSSFLARLWTDHRDMLGVNQRLGKSHYSDSPWWTWPLGGGVVWLAHQPSLFLCEVGNLVLRVGGFLIFILATWEAIRRRDGKVGFWLAAFATSYFPFAFVGRYMFLYHYYLPLLFSLLVAAHWLSARLTKPRFWDAVYLLVAGFVILSPVTYNFPLGRDFREFLFDYVPYFW